MGDGTGMQDGDEDGREMWTHARHETRDPDADAGHEMGMGTGTGGQDGEWDGGAGWDGDRDRDAR